MAARQKRERKGRRLISTEPAVTASLDAQLEEQLEFFGRIEASFGRAAQNCDAVIERFYSVGGHCLRLKFAGTALLEDLTAAFAHLRIAPRTQVDLTIHVCDSATTGVALPLSPWEISDYLSGGAVRGWTQGRLRASYETTSQMLSIVDTQQNRGYFWIRDAAQLPLYQRGSPFLHLLNPLMEVWGADLVHGGAVGTTQGGVMLVGKGGSGKSTATLCCLDSPLLYAADDYGLVTGGARPHFHSLFSSGKVNLADADRHPILANARHAGILDTQKALFFLNNHLPEKIIAGFPLRAIIVPRVSGERETRLRPISAARALMALAPSTLFQLPGAQTAKFARLSQLVKTLPTYQMDSGRDWSDIPRALTELVTTLNAPHQ